MVHEANKFQHCIVGCMTNKIFRCEKGATAIEFALLAIPYVFVIAGIIELSIMFGAASLLEGATNSAARLIRTGQIQQAGEDVDPEAMFRENLCEFTTALIDCDDVTLTVVPLTSFFDADEVEQQYDEDGNPIPGDFDAGEASDRMLVRAAYRYNLMTPFIGPLLGGSDSSITFISTIVLQTEPYDGEE